jgi:HKD family nuclease
VITYILDNSERGKSLSSFLSERLPNSNRVRLAVAFAKKSGWKLLQKSFQSAIETGADIELLIGLDLRITDASLLRVLTELSLSQRSFRVLCFCDPKVNDAPFYHPKVYILDGPDNSFISVGSSNLTCGGLRRNIEMNIAVEGAKNDTLILELEELYPLIRGRGKPFAPTHKFVDEYESMVAQVKRTRVWSKEAEITSKLKRRADDMPTVTLTPNELVGWQRLVYDQLPEGTFKNSDIYKYEEKFRSVYPDNNNVTAKIRQVLQQLTHMRLLGDLGRAEWRKL